MIVSTLIAASVASQPAPAPKPKATLVPTAEKKMACCEKMAKGEGCACCKDMAENGHGEHGMKDAGERAGKHAH
jgi:hypothetical protein